MSLCNSVDRFPNPAARGPDPYLAIPGMLSASLAFVLAVKMSLLLAFQTYRGMWRYLGIADLMTLAKVTVISSAISGCARYGLSLPGSAPPGGPRASMANSRAPDSVAAGSTRRPTVRVRMQRRCPS